MTEKIYNSGRGGARKGAGRPKGIRNPNRKKRVTTKLPPDVIKWLKSQPNMSRAIEEGIRLLMKE